LTKKAVEAQPARGLGRSPAPPRPFGKHALSVRATVERIDELLEVTYRSRDLGNVTDVLSETIYILLSLNTQEVVYQRIYAELRSRFPRWADVERASLKQLMAVLQPAGLQDQRARYLKTLLARVREDNLARGESGEATAGNDLTLEYLRLLPDHEVEAFLCALPGVGKKTARCVMSYALGRSSFAVDTHVARIFTRLGLVKPHRGKPDHDAFQALVPERIRTRLHINLVHHGRAVCGSPEPACNACVLVSFCGEGQKRVGVDDGRPTAVDLFAGGGGLGYGFLTAGWRVALAVERDKDAAQTYRANHPGTPVIEADISKVTVEDVQKWVGSKEPHAVLAGPPCQGYSAAGTRDPHAPTNLLFKHVARIANGLGARLVVLENVPGLHRVNGIGFADRILASLRRGRNVERYELVASDFGVPQRRRRVLFLARRKDLGPAPTAPEPTHSTEVGTALIPTPRLESLLSGDLEVPAGSVADRLVLGDGTEIANASTMAHSSRVLAKIRGIKPGKGPISYRRLERDVARTLVAGHRALPVHPWLHRTISVREAARIQGFPDSYVFCGTRANQPLQVANAVPPPLAAAIANHMLDFIGDETAAAAARKAATR
jgi:DNA (cytosine-5)-methyltransferase 1